MSTRVNAWIFLNEDEPKGTTYDDPTSCYQTLITNNVYQAVDLLYFCFGTILQNPDGTSTLAIGAPEHNLPYMKNILRDAPNNNQNILFGITLEYGNGDLINNIFSNSSITPQQAADAFAQNLLQYMQSFGLKAFDIDWEYPLSDQTTQENFKLLFSAVGQLFQQQGEPYYLTLSPADVGNLDAGTVNQYFSFINLQLYSGFTNPQEFVQAGVTSDLFAYGAKFESNYQTAQQAFDDNSKNYNYGNFTNWRLNSENFEFEQQQQKDLYQLVADLNAVSGAI